MILESCRDRSSTLSRNQQTTISIRDTIAASILCASLGALVACDGNATSGNRETTRRDSAGISIVENADASYAVALDWVIDSIPAIRIGGEQGKGAFELSNVVGVTRLGDGRVAVLDAATSEVRFFASDGSHLSTAGRAGGGPGEFNMPMALVRIGNDSLIVIDEWGSRYNVLDSSGRYARSFMIRPPRLEPNRPTQVPEPIALFADGSWLMQQNLLSCRGIVALPDGSIEIPESAPGGFCEDSSLFRRVNARGEETGRYGTFVTRRNQTVKMGSSDETTITGLHAGTFWGRLGEQMLFADGNESEIRMYAPDSKLTGIVRIPQKRIPRPSSREVSKALALADSSEEARKGIEAYQMITDQVELPRLAPAFTAMHVDETGSIWASISVPPTEAAMAQQSRNWWILDSTGVMQGTVRIPWDAPGINGGQFLRPVEIGTDYILGVRRDAAGVQEVVMYILRRQ